MKQVTSKEWTVLSMLEWATSYFSENNISSPRLSIEWLLADVLKVKRLDLYLAYNRPLSAGELDTLRPLVQRRSRHEPIQYILGFTEFMNCRLTVDNRVLVPRVETEQLVEKILLDLKQSHQDSLRVLDIGTGSGCIPIALAKACPAWDCYGIDISSDALHLSEINATDNDVHVSFLQGDFFRLTDMENLHEADSFDVIVSNPPYILPEEKESVEKQVFKFEPELALFHADPVSIYQSIAEFASNKLTSNGRLYFECNDGLTEQITNRVQLLFKNVNTELDYDNKKRFITAANPR